MESDIVNPILWALMVALYISSLMIFFFIKGQEPLAIGLFVAALFVGAMELQDRLDNRWGSK